MDISEFLPDLQATFDVTDLLLLNTNSSLHFQDTPFSWFSMSDSFAGSLSIGPSQFSLKLSPALVFSGRISTQLDLIHAHSSNYHQYASAFHVYISIPDSPPSSRYTPNCLLTSPPACIIDTWHLNLTHQQIPSPTWFSSLQPNTRPFPCSSLHKHCHQANRSSQEPRNHPLSLYTSPHTQSIPKSCWFYFQISQMHSCLSIITMWTWPPSKPFFTRKPKGSLRNANMQIRSWHLLA